MIDLPELQLMRFVFRGMEDILGDAAAENVISHFTVSRDSDFRIEDCIDLQKTLQEVYGEKGSLGLILRMGRVFFKDLFYTFGDEIGLNDPHYRMLPKPERIRRGVECVFQFINKTWDCDLGIREDETHWICEARRREGQKDSKAIHYFLMGLLQEFISWATGGKIYPVSVGPLGPEDLMTVLVIQKQAIV